MRLTRPFCLCTFAALLAACGTRPIQPSDKHLQRPLTHAAIPQPVTQIPLEPPKLSAPVETYSVVVTNVPAQEILFALARDAKINLDIHTGISGSVTLNALDQTLPQILARVAKQVDMRYELDNGTLTVMPDSPFLRNYKIDYVNMTRDAESSIVTSAQVTSAASNTNTGGSPNNSSISIKPR